MSGCRACDYKTASGRGFWLSRDPIEEEDGPNLYAYISNDPVNWIDPDGLQRRRINPGDLATPRNRGGAGRIPNIRPAGLMGPQTYGRVQNALKHIKEGKPVPGGKGGRTFENRECKLPAKDKDGQDISYREWDVNPKAPGQNRDAERIVTGSDGSYYYTGDHYGSFSGIPGMPYQGPL